MTEYHTRRDLLKMGAGLAAFAATDKPVRVGVVGVGNRGRSLLHTLLSLPGVEAPAVCDINEDSLAKAVDLVEKAGKPRPETYARGPEDYRRLVERNDLDAVITATPWELHTPVAVAAMKAGKYTGVEVPSSLTVEECWELVETSERTRVPCMMLENVCYFRNVLMVLNMARQGVLGDLLHCEAGYQHYINSMYFRPTGDLTWRGKFAAEANGNQYPTHPIGPVAWWLNINHGDRFAYLTSMSTASRGPHEYAIGKFGADSPAAQRRFSQGDINTTMIRTENGCTVTLYYNLQAPMPYDLIFRVQGTKGIFSGSLEKVHIAGRTPSKTTEPAWEDAAPYYAQYEHPLWKALSDPAQAHGHGGADYMTLYQFVKAARNRTAPPIDVYDSVTWSVIVPLTKKSVAARSAPVDIPDFTRGKWKTAKPVDPGEV